MLKTVSVIKESLKLKTEEKIFKNLNCIAFTYLFILYFTCLICYFLNLNLSLYKNSVHYFIFIFSKLLYIMEQLDIMFGKISLSQYTRGYIFLISLMQTILWEEKQSLNYKKLDHILFGMSSLFNIFCILVIFWASQFSSYNDFFFT